MALAGVRAPQSFAPATVRPDALLEIELPPDAPVPARASSPVEPSRAAMPVSARLPSVASAPARPVDPGVGDRAVATTEPAASREGWAAPSIPPADPVDLGIGSYWKSVAREPSAQPDVARGPSFRAEADARDDALGLGPAGPLVSAARQAASPANAPDEGAATLEVESDASGAVVSAHVVAGAPDARAWDGVARELVNLMATKRLALRSGARGLRARLSIVAERRSPGGSQGFANAGALPDDVPGADPVCVGRGLERKCLQGMPLGATKSISDVTNLVRPSRVVHVRLVDEATL